MASAPSYMIVGVGQCGTQIASDVHESVWAFSPGLTNCTLVDSESKSIQSKAAGRGIQKPTSVVARDASGRGNNWAHGYAGSVFEDGNTLGAAAVESIRRSLEPLSATPYIVLCHAWGGGTGSGVGSYMLERLREDILPAHGGLMSVGVCPFQSGGSPMQSINTVLTAATAMQQCSATLVQYNDEVLQGVQQLAAASRPPSSGGGARGASRSAASHMHDMNRVIAQRMSCLLPPQHVRGKAMLGLPSLLGRADGPSGGVYHLTAASVPSQQLNQRTPVASLLSAASAQVHASRRILGSLEAPSAAGNPAATPSHNSLTVMLRCAESASSDPVVAAWDARRSGAPAQAAAPADTWGQDSSSRSDWLYAGGSGAPAVRQGHESVPYNTSKDGAVQVCIDDAWGHQPCAAAVDSSAGAAAPLRGFAALAERKARIGAYMHLLEPYGADADFVLEACESVRERCGAGSVADTVAAAAAAAAGGVRGHR